MDTEAEDSCETDLEAEVDKEIKEEEIVIILCIYSQIKSIKLHVISISYILLRQLLCLYKCIPYTAVRKSQEKLSCF